MPPRSAGTAGAPVERIGGRRTLNPNAKHRLRIHPGATYLPGVVPENATKPIQGISRVADAFEKQFPDTSIEFVGAPPRREWIVTQLSSGQAPDVIQVNVEDVWQDIQKNWYVPLDQWLFEKPNPFVAAGQPGSVRWWDMVKYPVPTLGTMAPDGKMYCVVLDMIETGIYYNKSVFNQLGLVPPKDWVEFLELQRKLKEAGYVPLLADRQNIADWGVDLVFDQVYHDLRPLLDLDYDPRRGEYLRGYLDWDEIIVLHRKGFFQPGDPRWPEVWRILKEWRPYLAQDLSSTDFVKEFMTQRGAMYWSTSGLVNKLLRDPNRSFEFGIFYLPPIPRSYSRFAGNTDEMAVIGGSGTQYHITNTAVSDTPGNLPFDQRIARSERLQRVVAWLQFLTLPENCSTVVNETIALLPNTIGAEPHPQLRPFHDFLQQHYSMTKWLYTFDQQFNEVLLRMLELYLNGGMTQDEFMTWMERNITTGSNTIVRRKNPDLERLEKVWEERRAMRAEFQGLPDGLDDAAE
jgi:ABC-type glycerol-3-phosphate transport system substrate-binding protein